VNQIYLPSEVPIPHRTNAERDRTPDSTCMVADKGRSPSRPVDAAISREIYHVCQPRIGSVWKTNRELSSPGFFESKNFGACNAFLHRKLIDRLET